MKLEYLDRNEIDAGKWDHVIAGSLAETIYAYSWYLDAAAARWSALVSGDYESVMPLVWKRKLGIRYLYQPFYTQQLGVFSGEVTDPLLINTMLSETRRRFRWGRIQFNRQNLVGEAPHCSVEDRSNYVLDLKSAYGELTGSFSTNAKRNLKRAEASDLELSTGFTCEEMVRFKRENDIVRRSLKQYEWLLALLQAIRENSGGKVIAASRGDEVVAAAFFAYSEGRAIYLVSASNEKGKELRAMFLIVDAFIRENAGSGRILDFEGSVIPSLARFFKGFGATTETYQAVTFGKFPRAFSGITGGNG